MASTLNDYAIADTSSLNFYSMYKHFKYRKHKQSTMDIANYLDTLIEKARSASLNSYSPYSHFKVGAAILSSQGHIYYGCNVEFSDYLALHAELNALGSAVANGEQDFLAICVFSYSSPPVQPCGSCRQKLAEFTEISKRDLLVVAVNHEGEIQKHWLSELLPYSDIPVT